MPDNYLLIFFIGAAILIFYQHTLGLKALKEQREYEQQQYIKTLEAIIKAKRGNEK